MKRSYWTNNGKHQKLADAVRAMIPSMGSVSDAESHKALERCRKAINVYHDLYNNGMGNRNKDFRLIFRMPLWMLYDKKKREWPECFYRAVELKMDSIILKAAKAEGLAV